MSGPADVAGPGGDRPASAGSPHEVVNPPSLAPPTGFAHAVRAADGRTVYLGGQTALGPDGVIRGGTITEQFAVAVANLRAALEAAGGAPGDLVSLQVFTTDVEAYRASLRELGHIWRRHFGYHYPAMALLGVARLFDAQALVELMGVAVVAPRDAPGG